MTIAVDLGRKATKQQQIKGNGTYSTMQVHILSLHTTSATGVGTKVQNIFSECSHAAYQIKGNGA